MRFSPAEECGHVSDDPPCRVCRDP
ncbi:hypothetical protein [Streptomyces fragilis]|uniref:RecR protein domain-containing protein n=1 Tax=Streptomyces fragilis TaxID=67301 RepID=A0ABV2YKW2_9ACTN